MTACCCSGDDCTSGCKLPELTRGNSLYSFGVYVGTGLRVRSLNIFTHRASLLPELSFVQKLDNDYRYQRCNHKAKCSWKAATYVSVC